MLGLIVFVLVLAAGFSLILFGKIGAWLRRAGLVVLVLVVLLFVFRDLSTVSRSFVPILLLASAVASKTFWKLIFQALKAVWKLRTEKAKEREASRRTLRLPVPPPQAAVGTSRREAESPRRVDSLAQTKPQQSSEWVE